MIYIETQKLINGVVNKGGKVYIGKYGLDPLLPANKLTVYDQSETAITGFGLTLNFNSDVIVNGEAKGIYAKESYSIQFIDADGATYPKDFVNIVLPVDAEESENWVKTLEPVSDNIAITNDDEGNYQIDTGGLVDADTSINWVKTLIPETSNIQVTDDGEGNYTIDASALGGGDVFKTTDNTYSTGTIQVFDGVGVWNYERLQPINIAPNDSEVIFNLSRSDDDWIEIDITGKITANETDSVNAGFSGNETYSCSGGFIGVDSSKESSVGTRKAYSAYSVNDTITNGLIVGVNTTANTDNEFSFEFKGIFLCGSGTGAELKFFWYGDSQTAIVSDVVVKSRLIPSTKITTA